MLATAEVRISLLGVLNGQLPAEVVTIPVHLFGYIGLTGWDGVTVFADPLREAVLARLKTGWLEDAEAHILQNYGVLGKGRVVTITFDYTANTELNTVARMETQMSGNVSLRHTLRLYCKSCVPYLLKNTDGVSYDRMIAHELVHGVLNDWVNQTTQPSWFVEGIAEAIHGGLQRFDYETTNNITTEGLINSLNPTRYFDMETYETTYISNAGTSRYYAAGYVAIRYLHEYLKPFGIKRIFNRLQNGVSLDNAFNQCTPWVTAQAFVDEFTNGNTDTSSSSPGSVWCLAHINNTSSSGDTGAFGGSLVDGGTIQYDTTIFADDLPSEEQPLDGFVVDWNVPVIPVPSLPTPMQAYLQAYRMMTNQASVYTAYNEQNYFRYIFVKPTYVFDETDTSLSDLTGYTMGSAIPVTLEMTDSRVLFQFTEFVACSEEAGGCVIYSTRTRAGLFTTPLIFYIDLSALDPNALTQNTFSFRWEDPPGTLVF